MIQCGARHSISWIVEFGGQILSGSLAEQSDFGSVKLAFVLDIRLVYFSCHCHDYNLDKELSFGTICSVSLLFEQFTLPSSIFFHYLTAQNKTDLWSQSHRGLQILFKQTVPSHSNKGVISQKLHVHTQ